VETGTVSGTSTVDTWTDIITTVIAVGFTLIGAWLIHRDWKREKK
jgi:hypothetical protein